jgi:hypothetical protein
MLNWKGCEKKQSWPNLRYYLSIYLEGLILRETMKNFRQDSQSLGQYLNPGPSKCKAGELIIQV